MNGSADRLVEILRGIVQEIDRGNVVVCQQHTSALFPPNPTFSTINRDATQYMRGEIEGALKEYEQNATALPPQRSGGRQEQLVRHPWKLFQDASVKHLHGRVWVLTVERPGRQPEFCVQNGLGEPISPDCNQCTADELKAMAEYKANEDR